MPEGRPRPQHPEYLVERLAQVGALQLRFPWPFVEPETARRWVLDFPADSLGDPSGDGVPSPGEVPCSKPGSADSGA